MAVQDTNVIDLVVLDPKKDTVILCMVEVRDWGDVGALLPDLQTKFSSYLTYALDGQLVSDYPALAGKPIRFELKTDFPPTPREQQFLDIVTRQHLQPEGITFAWKLLSQPPV
jgi:hypothetical protein